MTPSNNDGLPRRRFLQGSVAGAVAAAVAATLGLPVGRSHAAYGGDPGFVLIGTNEARPQRVVPAKIPVILEQPVGDRVHDLTVVSEVPDRASFAKRARVPMLELPAPPSGYSAAVYRVAENLSGSVPFASVTYELPGSDGHPRSILSLIGNPRGAYPEPMPIRGYAMATDYRSAAGYEVRGKDRTIHFWYGGDVLYTFMHINYDSQSDVVGLTASGRLVESLHTI